MTSIDTSPKRLRELARGMRAFCGPLLENVRITLLALASEKEAQNHSEQHLEMVFDGDWFKTFAAEKLTQTNARERFIAYIAAKAAWEAKKGAT